MTDNTTTSLESTMASVNKSYQSRVGNLAAANERKTEEPEKNAVEAWDGVDHQEDDDADPPVEAEQGSTEEIVDQLAETESPGYAVAEETSEETDESEEDEPTPDMSWKKDAIIQYISESDDEVDRSDLELMTKTQLLERFTVAEG